MNIIMKKLDEIVPYENNPRENDDSSQTIAESIQEFGFLNPIIIDKDGTIICGHARLKAAMLLGLDEVPTITAEGLSEDQIRAFRIADNKTAEIAGWDFDALVQEFQGLSADNFDLNLTGFNEYEQTEYAQPDAIPEPPDRDEFRDYQEDADANVLKSFNIVITCEDDAEKGTLAEIIGESGNLKRLYRAEELIAMNP